MNKAISLVSIRTGLVRSGSLLPVKGKSFGRFTGTTNEARSRYSREELSALRGRLAEYLHLVGVELFESGTSLSCTCPFHNDSNPSFSVFGDGLERWICFRCNIQGDVFDFAIESGKATCFQEAVEHVKSVLAGAKPEDMPYMIRTSLLKKKQRIAGPDDPSMLELRKIGEVARSVFDEATDEDLESHAAQLGIPVAVLRKASAGPHGLGLYGGLLAFVYADGMKVRNTAGVGPRFFWKYGSATVPWRWSRVTEDTHTIYLTEGETDCLALLAIDLEDDPGVACVASPGTSFKREWAADFAGKKVVVCFDNDEPGQKAAVNVCTLLGRFAESVSLWNGGTK